MKHNARFISVVEATLSVGLAMAGIADQDKTHGFFYIIRCLFFGGYSIEV
jgi:hypothetical protein